MKRIRIIGLLILVTVVSRTQELKKMQATDLAAYIQHSDHPLIINFWATYCVPCMEEIPYFQKLARHYGDQGVELLLVSLDLPSYYPKKILEFAAAKHLTAGMAWLAESNADYFCPLVDSSWSGAIPSSLFVYPKENYRKFVEGSMSESALELTLRDMLKKP